MIDMDALKAAEEMFVEAFPLAKETRHAISHLEEAKNRLCEIKRHGVGRAAGVRGFVYANNLSGRSYSTMWKGTIVCYELSKATLDNLAKVRDAYFEVFRSAERATKKAADAFRSRIRE